MKPKKEKGGNRVYNILNRIQEFKQLGGRTDYARICPIYSPPQKCVKGECVWWDENSQKCWVLNPRPLREKPGRG